MTLTRERLEQVIRNHITSEIVAAVLIDTDAALRQQLATMQQQLDTCHGMINAQEVTLVIMESRVGEVDSLRQELATVTQERDVWHSRCEAHRIAKENCEKALTGAQADIATRDRTIAAMTKKAMSLVPEARNVDEAWGKLAERGAGKEGT
jgi:chromosome segregation ATPase